MKIEVNFTTGGGVVLHKIIIRNFSLLSVSQRNLTHSLQLAVNIFHLRSRPNLDHAWIVVLDDNNNLTNFILRTMHAFETVLRNRERLGVIGTNWRTITLKKLSCLLIIFKLLRNAVLTNSENQDVGAPYRNPFVLYECWLEKSGAEHVPENFHHRFEQTV